MTFSPRTLAFIDALLYLVLTLGFALLWHLHSFAPLYISLNWPRPEEADIPLGFLAVATQGIILGLLFQSVLKPDRLGRTVVIFCATSFAFLWSSHVIGDAAKCGFLPKPTFIAIETLYLVLQFLIYGGALMLIHRRFDRRCRAQE